MTTEFSTERFQLALNTWAQEATNPNDGAGPGTPGAVGSFWQEAGTPPGVPTTLYLKTSADGEGWARQNLTDLFIFNVKQYGALGDGAADDTAAIQAATDACNTAGGGIVYFPPGTYVVTTVPMGGNNISILVDDFHNIIFMGDGYASTISAVDNASADDWSVFLIKNGSTNIRFDNLRIIGTGMTNTVVASFLIDIYSAAGDANGGMTNFSISGCYLGPTVRSVLRVNGDDGTHTVNRIAVDRNTIDGASTITTGATGLVQIQGFFNNLDLFENYLFQGTNITLVVNASASAPASSFALEVQRNHFLQTVALVPTSTGSVSMSRGSLTHNTWTSVTAFVAASASNTANRLQYRGNVVVTSGVSTSPMMQVAAVVAGGQAEIIGNVVIGQDTTGAAITGLFVLGSVAASPTSALITDNVVERGQAAVSTIITNPTGTLTTTIAGNIAIVTAASNNQGQPIATLIVDGSPGITVSGNLCLGVGAGADKPATGIRVSPTAALTARLVQQDYNLIAGCRIGANFSVGIFTEWRSATGNNMAPSASATATIGLPPNNSGVTIAGSAGPGSQIALDSVTPIATVVAPVGSLCCNTTGGQATSVFRKEAGTGVSGGTGDWYGIGGYDLAFGALLGASVTANRFYAPGGLALTVESTTESKVGLPRPGIVRNLRVRCVAGTGGGTNTFTVRKNGVDTTLTVSFANTATNGADTTHSFTVAKADLLSARVSKSSAAGTPQSNLVLAMEII